MYLHRLTTPPALRNDRYAKLLLRGDKLTDASTYDRAVTNNGVTVVDSSAGKALQFSSAGSSYLCVGISPDLLLGKVWTIDFWVNSYSGGPFILTIGDGFLANGLEIFASSGCIVVASDGYGSNALHGTRPALDLRNHHVAVVADGTNMSLYVDGVADGSRAVWDVCQQTGGTHIGCYWGASSPAHYFDGQLYNFRITKGLARWTRGFTPPHRLY